MHRRLQFGMRESPASDRRHGSRQAVSGLSDANRIEQENVTSTPLTTAYADTGGVQNAASLRAATGEKSGVNLGDSSRLLPCGGFPGHAQTFEPLIGSLDAARLLGNIHVKTLQRYARRGNLPGYQIGGHWYFRESELDAWLRSRINSSCHPCRLSKEAK